MKTAKEIYQTLENETCRLAEYKNMTLDVYKVIRKKEQTYGNMFCKKYHEVEHKSELFAMRADIFKKIEEYRRKNKGSDIMWRGVSYYEVCKLEKQEVENQMKDDIREEMEMKKAQRGANIYNRLL